MRGHVALLTGWYYPDTVGGTESYVQTLAQDLQQDGYHVTVAAPSTDGEQAYKHDGVDVYRYPITSDPTTEEVRGEAPPRHLDVFGEWLDRAKPDLVHAHSYTRGCNFHHARRVWERPIPFFVTIHIPEVICPRGTMMRWGTTPCDGEVRPLRCGACVLQQNGIPKPAAWVTSAVSHTGVGTSIPGSLGTVLQRAPLVQRHKERLQSWAKSAEQVVVVAEWLKEVLIRNGISGEHVTVSRHGLSDEMHDMQQEAAERRAPRDPSRPLRIGFVGRFTEVKGPHVLVDAVRQLPKDVAVQARLYGIAQSARDRLYLSEMKQKAHDEPRVQFCGPLSDKNRVEAFASFDMLAVPSIGFETGPLTVLEAFAAGIPVVGSNHSGIAERVVDGESGVIVAPDNVDAWTAALRKVYEQHQADQWAWTLPELRSSEDIAKEMHGLYTSVLPSAK